MTRYDTISFLSDYGTKDEFVGVCKSVIRQIAGPVDVIDITHDTPKFDVRAASLTLVRAANYLAPGVVLAVVDPGTGTSRRAIAVELGDGESVLVGPDNGLLAPVTALSGGATKVVELTEPKFWNDSPSASFAGRDVFAPVAAHLCGGVSITDFGNEIDAGTLVPGLVPFSGEKEGLLHADVVWIDHYGNVQLNVTSAQLDDYGDEIVVTHANQTLQADRVRTFAELSVGRLGLMTDANGLISLVVNQGSAAQRYQINPGDKLTMKPAAGS